MHNLLPTTSITFDPVKNTGELCTKWKQNTFKISRMHQQQKNLCKNRTRQRQKNRENRVVLTQLATTSDKNLCGINRQRLTAANVLPTDSHHTGKGRSTLTGSKVGYNLLFTCLPTTSSSSSSHRHRQTDSDTERDWQTDTGERRPHTDTDRLTVTQRERETDRLTQLNEDHTQTQTDWQWHRERLTD